MRCTPVSVLYTGEARAGRKVILGTDNRNKVSNQVF